VVAQTRIPGTAPAGVKVTTDYAVLSSSFRDIGFSISDPHYYSYAITGSANACGVTAGAAATGIYTFQAYGDLDGDGSVGIFELSVGVNLNGEMYRAPGFFVTNELE